MTPEQDALIAALENWKGTAPPAPIPTITGDSGVALSSLFPGADLGAQINAALDAGFLHVCVPNAPNLVIRTPIKIRHACTIEFSNRYPQHIVCATNDKPVFEANGGIRHYRILGGIFDGAAVDTPSCFLLCGRTTGAVGQCGDTTPMEGVQCTGAWGMGCVVIIGAEVGVFERCHLWSTTGKGDSNWTGPRATVVIGNKEYWGVPWAYTPPSAQAGSTSANIFNNCDIRSGAGGSCFLIKGQVEDVVIAPVYLNATGRCGILIEAGEISPGNWTCPRGIDIHGGGRFETNGHPSSAGCPFMIVDGFDRPGMGLYDSSIYRLSMFVGSAPNSTPVVQTVRGAQTYAFEFVARHIENTNFLLDHRTADLNKPFIRSRFNAKIDCTGRAIAGGTIAIGGQVLGTRVP
jgi:hypothetical protein